MHIEIDFWNFFFGISIFLLFVYQALNIIKTQIIPYLLETMQLREREQVEVLEREELLSASRKKIEKKIIDQKKMFAELEHKMQVMRRYQTEKHERAMHDMTALKISAQHRLQQQVDYNAQRKALASILPEMFEQAEKNIKTSLSTAEAEGFLRPLTKI